MKKKLVLILTLVLTIGMLTSAVSAEEQAIKILIDGQELEVEVNPTVIEETTLVPLRAIFEALGAEVEWENETQTITAKKGDTTIVLAIDKKEASVNEEKMELTVAPKIIDTRTLVPVRFIAESLGTVVTWDGELNRVVITSGGAKEEVKEEATEEAITEEQALELLVKKVEAKKLEGLCDYDVKDIVLNSSENYLSAHPDHDKYHVFNLQNEYAAADFNFCVDKITGEIYIGGPAETEDGIATIELFDEWLVKLPVVELEEELVE